MNLFDLHKTRARLKNYGAYDTPLEFNGSSVHKTLARRKRAARWARAMRHALKLEFASNGISPRAMRLNLAIQRARSYHKRRSSFARWY